MTAAANHLKIDLDTFVEDAADRPSKDRAANGCFASETIGLEGKNRATRWYKKDSRLG